MFQRIHLLAVLILFVFPAEADRCPSVTDENASAADAASTAARPERTTDPQEADRAEPCRYQPLIDFTDDLALLYPELNRQLDDEWESLSCRQLAERLVDSPVVQGMACSAESTACVADGLCHAFDSPQSRQALMRYLMRLGQGAAASDAEVVLCRATDASCEASTGCWWHGRCDEKDGRCVVGDSDDCAQSLGCASEGLCALGPKGTCAARTEAHCRQSGACKNEGECAVGADGRCHLTDEAACARSQECAELGRCGLNSDGHCAPREPKHCAQSAACKADGECTLDHQQCVVGSDADCRQSAACAEEGHCSRIETRSPPSCGVGTDGDCRRSKLCKEEGKCKASGGECVRPETARRRCRTYERCEKYGLSCEPIAGTCANPPDFDCAASKACKKVGLCETVVVDGLANCRVTRPEHCRQSEVCKKRGRCGLGDRQVYDAGDPVRENVCVLTDAGCAQSERCKEKGACSKISVTRAHYGDMPRCAPTRPEHCERSRRCKEKGACELLPHPNEGPPAKYCGDEG